MRCYPPVSLYSMRAWMCTCLCMRMFVLFVCASVRECMSMRTCMHLCVCVCVCVCVSVCVCERERKRKKEKERERERNPFRQDRLTATGVASSFMYACSTVFGILRTLVCACAPNHVVAFDELSPSKRVDDGIPDVNLHLPPLRCCQIKALDASVGLPRPLLFIVLLGKGLETCWWELLSGLVREQESHLFSK